MMHKPHKATGGGHERVQAQPLDNAVTPNAHTQTHQQMHQHQLQNSNAIAVVN